MPLCLDGKVAAQALQDDLAKQVNALREAEKRPPCLAVIQVGDDAASSVYVNKKAKTAEALGMQSQVLRLPESTSTEGLLAEIQRLNNAPDVDGILVQLPLPTPICSTTILEAIAPEKDVDGFHPINMGRLVSGGQPYALPCTPAGIMRLLQHHQIPVAGKHVVVLGRSNIVGKPIAQLMLQANATVTLCHSHTHDLKAHLKRADVLVAAIGKPQWVKAEDLKAGVVVLDVGINRLPNGRLVGDVDYQGVAPFASAITPVPGGVGPMTIASLLHNTLRLYQQRKP